MIDDAAKANLYGYLQHEREAMLAKLDGLSEYDVRRPLTVTGTNLLGLVKHLATWEARYLGEVFNRPFPEPLPRWDVEAERLADMWVTEHESRSDVVDRYRRVWSTATRRWTLSPSMPRGAWPGGRAPRCRSSTFLSTCLPRPAGTPATPTSCAKSSTERWEPMRRAWPRSSTTRPSGRSGANRSSRPPDQPVDLNRVPGLKIR